MYGDHEVPVYTICRQYKLFGVFIPIIFPQALDTGLHARVCLFAFCINKNIPRTAPVHLSKHEPLAR